MRYNSQKKYWSTFEKLNMTLALAGSFADGRHIKKMVTTQRRPFTKLDQYVLSPNDCLEFCLQDHPEKIKEHLDANLLSFLDL